MITDKQIEKWTQQARRDDWHRTFVGSDIRQMLAEIVRHRTSLRNIANPIAAMQRRAKEEGAILNGQMAVSMSNNADYLKGIAREALGGTNKQLRQVDADKHK